MIDDSGMVIDTTGNEKFGVPAKQPRIVSVDRTPNVDDMTDHHPGVEHP